MSQHLIDGGRRPPFGREQAGSAGGGAPVNGGEPSRSSRRTGELGDDHDADSGGGGSQDATSRALDALSEALQEMSSDQKLLEKRLRKLQHERSAGRSWRDILAEEEPPGTMQIVSRMLACLAKASGALRKDLVDSLRREGASIPAIAKLFGVTHQRVSNLLRRPSD